MYSFVDNVLRSPEVPPGFATLYDSGGLGILDLIPPTPVRPEDQILRGYLDEFFRALSRLINAVIEADLDFDSVEDLLTEAIRRIPVGEKLRRRLTYRLMDVKVACSYRRQVLGRGYRLRSFHRDLEGIQVELRRLGQLY